jgi:hypothetical protein
MEGSDYIPTLFCLLPIPACFLLLSAAWGINH